MRSPRRQGYKSKSKTLGTKARKKYRSYTRARSGYMPKGKRGRY